MLRISIHALLAESDTGAKLHDPGKILFLSTLSLRRATDNGRLLSADHFISIHALLAESDAVCNQLLFDTLISIHALLAESDDTPHYSTTCRCLFLSTLSLRRATPDRDQQDGNRPDFYPRSPCGERRSVSNTVTPPEPFLSTLSLRRATSKTGLQQAPIANFYPRSPCGERLKTGTYAAQFA